MKQKPLILSVTDTLLLYQATDRYLKTLDLQALDYFGNPIFEQHYRDASYIHGRLLDLIQSTKF